LPQNDPCPQGWRLPTIREIDLLLDINYVEPSYQEANAVGNPVEGMFYGPRYTDKATWNDFNGSIFLPSVPYRCSDGNFISSLSVYWAGAQYDDFFAYCIVKRSINYNYELFSSYDAKSWLNFGYKMSGACVRCVKDE
jgi:uncharacterized protein (TIGR02145 family)